jgi:hypothetical protein
MLRDALVVLASPAPDQVEHLRRLGPLDIADELALEYDDIAAAAEDMREKAELTELQCERVLGLNDYLGSFSGAQNSHLWTIEALGSARQWSEVRRLACEILELFGHSTDR